MSHGAEDITEGILCNDDIKECRLSQYAHRSVVDEHIIGVYLRILWLHLLGNVTVGGAKMQDTFAFLSTTCQVLVALHGKLKPHRCAQSQDGYRYLYRMPYSYPDTTEVHTAS